MPRARGSAPPALPEAEGDEEEGDKEEEEEEENKEAEDEQEAVVAVTTAPPSLRLRQAACGRASEKRHAARAASVGPAVAPSARVPHTHSGFPAPPSAAEAPASARATAPASPVGGSRRTHASKATAAPGPPPPPPPASDDDGASAEVDDDVGVAPEVGSPPSAMPTFAKTKKPTSEGHGNYPGPPPPPPPDDDGAAAAAADADPTAAPTRESKRMPGFVQGKKKAGHS